MGAPKKARHMSTAVKTAKVTPNHVRAEYTVRTDEVSAIEDYTDYIAVQRARAEAASKGEKPTSWKEFKKTLDI